jgi:uncharacterized Zn-finger protein
MDESEARSASAQCVEITARDLPLHCPRPEMSLWNAHPRVFLDVEASGEALCPYCSTRYVLVQGAASAHP